jgi:hypothetical protein
MVLCHSQATWLLVLRPRARPGATVTVTVTVTIPSPAFPTDQGLSCTVAVLREGLIVWLPIAIQVFDLDH